MTSRRSSGSSRAESAVEPTRSQNSTVSCRRSAARGAASSSRCASLSGRAELGDRAQELLAVTEREPELLQVLVGQVRQDLAVNVVLGKDRPVAAEPQPFEPLVDVAHGRAPPPSVPSAGLANVPLGASATQALRSAPRTQFCSCGKRHARRAGARGPCGRGRFRGRRADREDQPWPRAARISSATMLMILIIGLIAGPAVSL